MKTKIIYEDEVILVIHKPAGIATQTQQLAAADVESELKNYLAVKTKNPYLAVIHRLDQPVEGLLVFAKTKEASSFLNTQLQKNLVHKRYQALLYSENPDKIPEEASFQDYLRKDEKGNHSAVVGSAEKDAKLCSLSYRILNRKQNVLCAEITIQTGRHHQIRVQMSYHGLPLLGDLKYGSEASSNQSKATQIRQVALCATELELIHPVSKEKLSFQIVPEFMNQFLTF